jgi:uncharacterized caspase-like protein
MVNSACVAIGINRYQYLPPLNYGQADAQALWQFLVNQANLPPNQCLLLTDTSPLTGNQSTYPTRDNIWRSLEVELNGSRPAEDWRWFFFSGYGVSWERADYLLPIDANPKDIPGTGIPALSLLTSLKERGGQNLLVFLDISRSPGLQAGAPVGAELVELARQMGIVLILSSQLDQFSHEAAALGHGLFTTALLEALSYYHTDVTLEKLEEYLRDRLPELSRHHWRPIQTPLLVIPPHVNRQQLILPIALDARTLEGNSAQKAIAFTPRTRLDAQDAREEDFYNGTAPSRQKTPVSVLETPDNTSLISATQTPSPPTAAPMAMVPYPNRWSQPVPERTPWWRALLLWGGVATLLLGLMIAAVLLRNRDAFSGRQAIQTPTSTTQISPNKSPATTGKASPNASSKLTTAAPQTSLQNRLQANQAALDRAKRLIRPNQVSLFNKAIVEALQVKPGDPLYQQAQQNIKRWSGVILDIAEGRAKAGNYEAAIAAAQLVPKEDPSTYAQAQQTINQWRLLSTQQQQNKSIIQAAKKQIKPNQASSYNRAITTLRQVLPSQPGYAEAQQLTAQWSRTIYLIAQSRAAEGQMKEAIQAAALVPPGTSSAEAAKMAIAKWQQAKP